ncbi:MAG: hypothetical protein JWM11_5045 [Planctomycetaceae bacterium]|nr:hypothetical protein [Planctomycetaceae bacterium]
MSATEKKDQFRLGFLTAVEVPEQGYVGGLLITNRHGRPLEFQCTAPLKPNRTQEILYGTTLGSYVVGEVIARTLIEKVGVKPHLILTELAEILELRNHVSMPVGFLEPDRVIVAETTSNTLTEQPTTEAPLKIGRQWFRLHAAHTDDRADVENHSTQIPKDADMREPFERVREALLETVKNGVAR